MVKGEISILKGNKISAKNEKLLREVVGKKTTKDIIKEAKKQGLTDLGKSTETQSRRAYTYFAKIYNERIRADIEEKRKRDEVKGIATFDVNFKFKRKGQTKTFNKPRSFSINTTKGDMNDKIKKRVQRAIDGEEGASPIEEVSHTITAIKFIEQNKKTTPIRKTKMKQNGVINLDGHIDNSVWCKNRDMCVPDFIQYRLGKTGRHKKKITDKAIQDMSICGMNNDVDKNPNANGYTIEHIENYCYNNDLSMYALSDDKVISQYVSHNHNNVPLVFSIANNHLYPIFDKSIISSIVRTKTKIKSDNIQKGKVKTDNKLEVEIVELEENETPFDATRRIMKRENTMIYPSSHIYTKDGGLNSFTLNNKRYVLNYDKDIQDYYGEDYNGQTQSNIVCGFDKWNKLPTSYLNPEVANALYATNVKWRNHYGLINENIPINENMNCLDIRRCYRACMENPLDDLMIIPFNRHISKKWGTYPYPLGIYYIVTNDMTICHGSNWYCNSMLNKLINENIKFKILAFIKGDPVGKNILKDLIDEINDKIKNEDLNKLVINCISGMLGKTESKITKLKMDTDVSRLWNTITPYALENNNFVVNETDGIYSFGISENTQHMNNNLPMYIQILDFANIRLFDMAKSMGGEIVARKTDCVVTTAPQQYINGKNIGEYRISDHPKITNPQIPVDFRKAKLLRYNKLEYISGNWSSNHYEEILRILQKNNGLCLIGRAGTGKTYCAKAMRDKIDNESCISTAFTNKAALVLNGDTIHKILKINMEGKLDRKYITTLCKNKKLFIVDEYTMVTSHLWKLLAEVKRITGIMFLVIGDYRQLPPIEDEVSFDYLKHSVISYLCNGKALELTTRQRYDKELWDWLEVKEWDNMECIEFNYNMINDFNVTYFNKTRKKINERFNIYEKNDNSIFCEVDWNDKNMEYKYHQDTYLYEDLPIIANTTYNKLDLKKNEFYRVTEVTDTTFTFSNDYNTQTIPHSEYHKYFLMGYAFSVYKSQGETAEGNVNVFDYEYMKQDDRFIYTAASRGKLFEGTASLTL